MAAGGRAHRESRGTGSRDSVGNPSGITKLDEMTDASAGIWSSSRRVPAWAKPPVLNFASTTCETAARRLSCFDGAAAGAIDGRLAASMVRRALPDKPTGQNERNRVGKAAKAMAAIGRSNLIISATRAA